MTKARRVLLSIVFPFVLSAQLPNTEVWLFKVSTSETGTSVLKEPLNISQRSGYDNQPSFSEDGKNIYYVSVREDNQADIYSYTIRKKETLPFTKTKESEYSPQISSDGNHIAAVVVEADSAQRIHFKNLLTGLDETKLAFDSVGYYCELNADTIVYYKLTEPHSLRYYVRSSKENKWLGDSPIRGFKAVNRHTLIYGLKDSSKVVFYTYDFLLKKAKHYAEYPSLDEDICWHEKWGLIKPEGNKLFRYDESKAEWLLLFDLSSFGIKKITRVAFDPKNKYLVIVDNL